LPGVKPGDVITKLDVEGIKTSADVVDYVSSRTMGAPVDVTVVRDQFTRPAAWGSGVRDIQSGLSGQRQSPI
jgi:S1-C subfamily serine protease